jgi:hypothetical protein
MRGVKAVQLTADALQQSPVFVACQRRSQLNPLVLMLADVHHQSGSLDAECITNPFDSAMAYGSRSVAGVVNPFDQFDLPGGGTDLLSGSAYVTTPSPAQSVLMYTTSGYGTSPVCVGDHIAVGYASNLRVNLDQEFAHSDSSGTTTAMQSSTMNIDSMGPIDLLVLPLPATPTTPAASVFDPASASSDHEDVIANAISLSAECPFAASSLPENPSYSPPRVDRAADTPCVEVQVHAAAVIARMLRSYYRRWQYRQSRKRAKRARLLERQQASAKLAAAEHRRGLQEQIIRDCCAFQQHPATTGPAVAVTPGSLGHVCAYMDCLNPGRCCAADPTGTLRTICVECFCDGIHLPTAVKRRIALLKSADKQGFEQYLGQGRTVQNLLDEERTRVNNFVTSNTAHDLDPDPNAVSNDPYIDARLWGTAGLIVDLHPRCKEENCDFHESRFHIENANSCIIGNVTRFGITWLGIPGAVILTNVLVHFATVRPYSTIDFQPLSIARTVADIRNDAGCDIRPVPVVHSFDDVMAGGGTNMQNQAAACDQMSVENFLDLDSLIKEIRSRSAVKLKGFRGQHQTITLTVISTLMDNEAHAFMADSAIDMHLASPIYGPHWATMHATDRYRPPWVSDMISYIDECDEADFVSRFVCQTVTIDLFEMRRISNIRTVSSSDGVQRRFSEVVKQFVGAQSTVCN